MLTMNVRMATSVRLHLEQHELEDAGQDGEQDGEDDAADCHVVECIEWCVLPGRGVPVLGAAARSFPF